MKISCFSVESAFRFKVGFITVVYILILSLLIGFRSADVGTDTQRYVNHYLRGSDGDYYGRFDLVFSFLLNFFSSSGIPVEIFLSFVAFVVAASYYSIFFKVIASQVNESSGTTKIITLLLFYSSFLLLSSWFFSSSTNGLRQGMSLAVLLVAVGFLLKEGIGIKFFVIYVLSVGLHSSTILILPFIFLYLVSYGILLLVWMAASIGYVFGLNEILVELVSNFFEIGIYEKIKYYSLDVPESGMGIYEGFVPVFFVYTIFWPLILMFALRLKAVGVSVNKYSLVVSFIRIYMIFSLPYFVFGFGPFSNRYSYIAWFIVPVMQLLVISMIKIRDELYVGILFFIVSLVYFIGYRLEMLRVFS